MNINSVDNGKSWGHFLKLANQARVRNAGFDLPITPQRTIAEAKGKKVFQNAISGMPRAGKLYTKAQTTPKPRSVLGARFDSYA